MNIKRWILMLALLCMPALYGCQEEVPVATTAATAAPITYTVSFQIQGQVQQVQLTAGDVIQPPLAQAPGYRFAGWLDDAGAAVDPAGQSACADVTYTAVFLPDMTTGAPYLFADEYGFFRPDDPLTGGELTQALTALAADPAVLDQIALPQNEELVTRERLGQVLDGMFIQTDLDRMMFNLPEGTVRRGMFARVMNDLLDRNATDLLVLEDGQSLPRDLALDHPESEDVLRSMMRWTLSEDGLLMKDAVLAMQWTPGFVNLGGWLYYADENGQLCRDQTVNTLQFGPDGRYTSGDAELDAIVAEYLDTFIRENPEKDREGIQYVAFLHCRDNYRYVNRGLLDRGETGWSVTWAKQMFTTGAGNCYSYAAIFCELARGLGYDAYCISGSTSTDYDPHGWVQIPYEDGEYIFDPELAMTYMKDGKNYEAMYKMTYELARGWPYHWPRT